MQAWRKIYPSDGSPSYVVEGGESHRLTYLPIVPPNYKTPQQLSHKFFGGDMNRVRRAIDFTKEMQHRSDQQTINID